MNIQKEKEELLKTRKGFTMKMTYTDALTLAINTMSTSTDEVTMKAVKCLSALRATYVRRNESRPKMSDEAKAARSAKQKAATAAKRAETASIVVPILRKVIDRDMTAKEIFESAKEFLPQDFTAPKVQTYLLREMKDELVKTETKGKANTYRRA